MSNLMSEAEIRMILRVTKARLQSLIDSGQFPAPTRQLGSRRFWAITDAADALDDLRQRPALEDRRERYPATAESR